LTSHSINTISIICDIAHFITQTATIAPIAFHQHYQDLKAQFPTAGCFGVTSNKIEWNQEPVLTSWRIGIRDERYNLLPFYRYREGECVFEVYLFDIFLIHFLESHKSQLYQRTKNSLLFGLMTQKKLKNLQFILVIIRFMIMKTTVFI
jgi:hypothetical protein